MNNKKNKEVNSIEELQIEIAKSKIIKGSNKVGKELLEKIKNSEIRDNIFIFKFSYYHNIFYYKNTNKRLYDNKPEWAEIHLHTLEDTEIKIHLTGEEYNQQTLDLLNHILYLREIELSNNE